MILTEMMRRSLTVIMRFFHNSADEENVHN